MAADEQTHRDLDAPAPPGSPMREDVPDADVMPGPAPGADPGAPSSPGDGEPGVQPSSTPDGPQPVPPPSTPPGEPGPDPSGDPTPPSQAGFENAQAENAGSSLDEPSDGSGGE